MPHSKFWFNSFNKLQKQSKVPVIIHIGLPRAASTYLQKEVFPKFENVNFFNSKTAGNPYTSHNLLDRNKINIISEERFSGVPYKSFDKTTRNGMITKLHRIFGNAKIILILRNEEDWVKSVYNYVVQSGFPYDFNTFCKEYFIWSYTKYDEYINALIKSFNDVLIINYDDLKNDVDKVVNCIAEYCGTTIGDFRKRYHNKSLSKRALEPMIEGNKKKIFNEHIMWWKKPY